MSHDAVVFVQGIAATGAWMSGLFFLRFWRDTRDALFGYFAAAFWLLALSWSLLAVFNPQGETQPYVYGLRLVAFLLIIAAMVVKNTRAD